MKKWYYRMPAILSCLLYGFLTLLVGGFGGFQWTAWAYILLPVLAALLLERGCWWGFLPGMVLGTILLYRGSLPDGGSLQTILGMAAGIYYLIAGVLCFRSR